MAPSDDALGEASPKGPACRAPGQNAGEVPGRLQSSVAIDSQPYDVSNRKTGTDSRRRASCRQSAERSLFSILGGLGTLPGREVRGGRVDVLIGRRQGGRLSDGYARLALSTANFSGVSRH